MKISWRIHGSEFPALLYIAAYTLVGASFTRMPKPEDFAKGTKEIDGFEVWSRLRCLYAWFKTKYDFFPFSRPEIFREPKDIDVAEAASCLLEMTSLRLERHLPPEDRSPAPHYGVCEYHLGCYTLTLSVFLDHLYRQVDFDETILGREEQLISTLTSALGKIVASTPFIAAINDFYGTMTDAAKPEFVRFMREVMPPTELMNEEAASRLITEFKKRYPDACPSA